TLEAMTSFEVGATARWTPAFAGVTKDEAAAATHCEHAYHFRSNTHCFSQALIRPWPGGTWLQKCAISGLHAPSTALAAGLTFCAIAPDVESSKMAPIMTNFFFSMVCPLFA